MVRRPPHAPAERDAADASDASILRRLAGGESGALGALYDRHQPRVRRFVARATSNAEDVDDLVHVTFLTAAKIAGRYDGRLSCHPWLIGIAAQLVRRRHRAVRRLFDVVSSLARGPSAIADPAPALLARRDVQRALSRLSPAKRIAIVMAEVEGLTCAEISEALRIPIGTVWTRLHAARRDLRRLLHDESEGGAP
jgi:RNA polymerase sigma factor (sigma-70 family)